MEGEEEDEHEDEAIEETLDMGQKRKAPNAVDITLPHLLDVVVAVEDMLGKVPKLKYAYHDITDITKFPDFTQEVYLEEKGEVRPLGKPIMDPTQWFIGIYNSGMMNLLDIQHFGHGKNVGLCIKQLLAKVHRDILWMDRSVPIDVDIIAKITCFPTSGVNPENYLDYKAKDKEIS